MPMKTLGLIGGMSWESTLPYYRLINQAVREKCGGLHSARLILYSVNFEPIERLQREAAWAEAGTEMVRIAHTLVAAGADAIVLCTNTMHRVAPAIEGALDVPFLHIADPTGEAIRAAGINTIGLLGTRFTMEQPFYRQRLEQRFGLHVITPPPLAREQVHRVIYDELCQGVIDPGSRRRYCDVIDGLVTDGAQAIIFGCTEISLLLASSDVPVPVFDTTVLHARYAAHWALNQ